MRFTDFVSIEMSGPFELTGRLHSAQLSKVHKGMAHRIFGRFAKSNTMYRPSQFYYPRLDFFILLIVVPQNDTGFN